MRCRFAPESGLQSGDLVFEIAGETLVLLPERALLWPERATVMVADVHLGKAATFRHAGIHVPEEVHQESLDRLSRLLTRTRATRLIVLGDLWHSRHGLEEASLRPLQEWRRRHGEVELGLVAGNHDLRSGPPPEDLHITDYAAGGVLGPFRLLHEPEFKTDPAPSQAYAIAGHLHPMLRLEGGALGSERLRCFWITAGCMVLPAFGEFAGGYNIQPEPTDRVAVIAGSRVMPVPGHAFDNGMP